MSLITDKKCYWCQKKVSKGIGVIKSNVFKQFVMALLASTRVYSPKKFLVFVNFEIFLDVKHILHNCRSQELSLDE